MDSEHLEILRYLLEQRDECAKKIGVAAYQFDLLKAEMCRQIDELKKRESEQLMVHIRKHGLDESKKWRANLDTGEIKEVI